MSGIFRYLVFVFLVLVPGLVMAQMFNPKEKFDWGLKGPDVKSCGQSAELFQRAQLYLRKSGGELFLFARDPKPLMNLLTDGKDAITIEKVYFDSYREDSSKLKRNNGSSVFNGRVLQPIYREDLLNSVADEFMMNPSDRKSLQAGVKLPPYWLSRVGTDTEESRDFEYNIVLIKNNSVCAIKYHKNNVGQVHDFYEGVEILPEWPDRPLKILPILKTFSFHVPFDRNTTEIKEKDKNLYTDVLDDFIVRGVQIWAYASVEGQTGINEQLQTERANVIRQSLEQHLPPQVQYRVIAKENWERFDQQLQGSEFDSLRDYSRDEIKELLKREDNLLTFDHMLHDQRKAVVKVFYNTKPQDYDTVHILNHNFRQALDSIASRKGAGRTYSYYVRDAEGLYNWLFEELQKGEITAKEFMSWNFPLDATYHMMLNNQFWYQYYHPEFATAMMENNIKLVGLDREASDVERFNLIAFLLEKEQNGTNNSGLTIEDLGKLMRSRTFRTIDSDKLIKIAIPLFARLAVHYHQDYNNWERRDVMLNDLITLFDQDSTKTLDNWYQLAELSAALSNEYVTNEIIDRFHESGDNRLIQLDLEVNYQHFRSTQSDELMGYYDDLLNSFESLGKDNWCDLFDKRRISFQALDEEELFRLYRTSCVISQSP